MLKLYFVNKVRGFIELVVIAEIYWISQDIYFYGRKFFKYIIYIIYKKKLKFMNIFKLENIIKLKVEKIKNSY